MKILIGSPNQILSKINKPKNDKMIPLLLLTYKINRKYIRVAKFARFHCLIKISENIKGFGLTMKMVKPTSLIRRSICLVFFLLNFLKKIDNLIIVLNFSKQLITFVLFSIIILQVFQF